MKKRLTILITTLALMVQLFCVNLTPVYGLTGDDIFSNEALAVDINNDETLFHKNTKDESVPIASLTKIMTYVLVVENISDLNTKITVPAGTEDEMYNAGASVAGLEDGYEYTALELLYGLMLPSGCDAADVLAKHIADGDYDKFVAMMNQKAVALGMGNTTFYSASGLTVTKDEVDYINVSTEQDLYKLAKYAFDLPYFQEIIGTEWYTITGEKDSSTDQDTVRNTNYMMGDYNGDEYYYIYSLGGKTGNLSTAGRCLISFAAKGNLEVVAITLGVPGEHDNYHLRDHRKIFDYVFEKYTGNITIDIGGQYRSVDIGETIQLTPTTSDATDITWKSSNEAVATVDENGVVTGKKLGQVRITAATSTGNKDQAYVSVGFYNGIDVKYSSGPADSNGKLGYGEIDWEFVKETGVDFAIIRAGYGLYGPDSDPYFVENIKGAVENDIDVLVSYDSYADTEEEAVADAKYLVNYMNTNVADYVGELDLPIVYNLFKSNVEDVTTLKQVSLAFDKEMEAAGYETIIEHGKTKMSAMELKEITDADIGLYMIYKPYYPDYSARMYAMNNGVRYDADIWQYRGDAYFGNDGIGKETTMAAMYMDSIDLDGDPVEPEEPAEPSDPKDPENENAADENDSSIDTSDSFNMTGCIMVMLISLIIMAAIGRRSCSCYKSLKNR